MGLTQMDIGYTAEWADSSKKLRNTQQHHES